MITGIIYHAFDTTNGKAYVGQTNKTLKKRQWEHLRRKVSYPFHNALCKRSEMFVWTVLTTGLTTQKDLDDAEIYWGTYFDCLVPNGYNLRFGKGRVIISDEERAKRSVTQKRVKNTPEARTRNSAAQKIAWARPEVKANIVAAQKLAWAKRKAKM